ncbi:cell division protein FtsQ/DivIB [Corynebacterium aquilae]|uniref:POTRA domain-containing protein n=1 Tax=Corynebacterium aquilae DSM 44791 TaxID=1431546 RepID=A0A1L7CGW5_9CORY|nr:FtsQ-type POTRA domain-containing protein [Corynebacterium aquilae]APT85087.1 hypothetical protein CAQU_08415 [Corynebacterium aquilae DSM 44791]
MRAFFSSMSTAKKFATSAVAVVVVLGVLVACLVSFPILTVKNITVEGNENTTYEEVLQASGLTEGQNLLTADVAQASRRVHDLPWISKVRVERQAPSTINIEVHERTPLLFAHRADGDHLIDDQGVPFVIAPPPAGAVEVLGTVEDDPETLQVAAKVVRSLAPEVRAQISAIDIASPDRITLLAPEDRSVYWGSSDEAEAKAKVTGTVLTQPGKHWNVSDPFLVTVKD